MEIQSSISTSQISLANIVRAANGQGRVSFPVKSTAMAYANFKNINTVPSSNGGGSYSLSRLRALDNLIEQLNRIKDRNKVDMPGLDNLDSDDLNFLISELSEEIHTKLQADTLYKVPVESSGLLFNMLI